MHKCIVSIVLFPKLSATAHVITSRFSFGGFGCGRKLFEYIDCAEERDVFAKLYSLQRCHIYTLIGEILT